MGFTSANDHPNRNSPEDPLCYAPRSARSKADPRSNATPQTRSDHLPPTAPLSRFDEMREEAFAKFTRPLESQFVYERRPPRVLLATAGAAAIGVIVILALVLFNVFPKPKSDPSELAVSISTPASATPAQVTSEDSQALLQGFKQFQKIQGSENPEHAVSEPASAGTAKEGPEKSQALLEKFMQWQQRK
ncbi:hypothetical protein ACFIOY_12565 [Bradyrhizobium sp. TZ2]